MGIFQSCTCSGAESLSLKENGLAAFGLHLEGTKTTSVTGEIYAGNGQLALVKYS